MKLTVKHINEGADDTIGLFFINDDFRCFTLEDQSQLIKVAGETRIPNGEYDIALRTVGGFHNRYSRKYGTMHEGMLQVMNVPNFEYVLIHVGNDDDDTAGCILLGDTCTQNITRKGFIGASVLAYKRVYEEILAAIKNGEAVTLTIEELQV
jgi:hypothetical protein